MNKRWIPVVLVPAAVVTGAVLVSASWGSQSRDAARARCGAQGWPSTSQGRPAALGSRAGYFVWHDGAGWHLGARGASGQALQGQVTANAAVHLAGATPDARAHVRAGRRTVTFGLTGTGRTERLDFLAGCATRIGFRFGPTPATASASRQPVYLGSSDPAPGTSFALARPSQTGIAGQILVGPTCPVVGPGVICPPGKPVPGTVKIESAATARGGTPGRFVKTVETDANGSFATDLPPGSYVAIVVKSSTDYPLPKPARVDVQDGVVTQITLQLDTGIR